MKDQSRLIERAFPLKQASLDSVHEKNVRHGHISTLHIWPARRPLAASRAALIATLLPDPGTPEERRKLSERIGGRVVQKIEKKKMPSGKTVERIKEETQGGVLNWIGLSPKSGSRKKKQEQRLAVKRREDELAWFRRKIHEAYGGRAPRVLDPFAGGGAIPLEAMRLGCEVTAVDINPVAWFILKCTLEYPQRLAGKRHPLPDFILQDEDFMEEFYKAHPHLGGRTRRTKKQHEAADQDLFESLRADSGRVPEANLAWHVRAWGRWVLDQARKKLAQFYPTYADFEPLDFDNPKSYERQEMRLGPLKNDGTPDIDSLNAELSEEYLADKRNPRWVIKPTVAYLWARTVTCKNCRAEIPLLKTRWLWRKNRNRVLLKMTPNPERNGVDFDINHRVFEKSGNSAAKREHDKRIGSGTMSRSGATCPCCNAIMTLEDLRIEHQANSGGFRLTAVAVEGQKHKEHRLPTTLEIELAAKAESQVTDDASQIPFALPTEPTPKGGGSGAARAFSIHRYGIRQWASMFHPRQQLALVHMIKATHEARKAMIQSGYADDWTEGLNAYLACAIDRLVDFANVNVQWKVDANTINHALVRFAIQITWDFAESNVIGGSAGSYLLCLDRVALGLDNVLQLPQESLSPHIYCKSSAIYDGKVDLVVTDPPYYDAIPYSDLMDWFYVWLRRTMHSTSPEYAMVMDSPLCPKWEKESEDGELIDDETRHGGDSHASKLAYERGMERVFQRCNSNLVDGGRMVVVFANKSPDAWETLVAAIIRAGFIVAGSWPIQTEQPSRTRGLSSAALASSVWLVCKKRPAAARSGWDNHVLEDMRRNITERLREYWDAGIRGPDFVWAATGPALEAYSKHPTVKKANDPGQTMTVGEFLSHVRRIVVDFVVGQVLTGEQDGSDMAAVDSMDAPTAYYLLHRHDFDLGEVSAGACILYATACGISDRDLEATWNLISHEGASPASVEEEDEVDPGAGADRDADSDSGSKIVLKSWDQRKHRSMGYEAPSGTPIPLIDRVHRLMHLWKAGDVYKVDEYLDDNGLRRQELFRRLVQSLIELARAGSDERKLLESLSNHIEAKGATPKERQATFAFD